MLWRTVALSTGLVFALAVGCGGKAVVDADNDDDGSGGSGGATGQGGAATSNSSSSTGMPSCQGYEACCQAACDKGAADGVPCWPDTGVCGCQSPPPAACEAALEALYACVSTSTPFGFTCNANNGIVRVCGLCDAEEAAAAAAGCPFPCQ